MYKINLKTGQIQGHRQTLLFGNLYSRLNNFHIEYPISQQQPLKQKKKKKALVTKFIECFKHNSNILSFRRYRTKEPTELVCGMNDIIYITGSYLNIRNNIICTVCYTL